VLPSLTGMPQSPENNFTQKSDAEKKLSGFDFITTAWSSLSLPHSEGIAELHHCHSLRLFGVIFVTPHWNPMKASRIVVTSGRQSHNLETPASSPA
jgi:hypothetical protein